VDRRVPGTEGVWALSLYTETGLVLDEGGVLSMRDPSFEPLDEAAGVLTELGYVAGRWTRVTENRWTVDLRTGDRRA
jgi:hypothetical protein